MSYHIAGLVSAAIFLLTLVGLVSQLQMVGRRRQNLTARQEDERPTAILSVNQFVSSFLAFFSFFVYGACLSPFNHYLVWPRIAASILTLAVLYEIMRDRRDGRSRAAFSICLGLLVGVSLTLLFNPGADAWARTFSVTLIVVVTFILAQGYLHQVALIRQSGRTGGVSSRLHQYFFWKDASTIAFSFTMGAIDGWPLLLLSTVSGITKLITLWHFRWVRLSPLAAARRKTKSPAVEPVVTSA
jgi:hypothetical protein